MILNLFLINSILLSFGSIIIANGLVNGLGASPHVTYVNEQICQVISSSKLNIYYNRVKLQCEWKKWVDAIEYEKHLDPGSYEASQESNQTQHIYDFEFISTEKLPNETVYGIIDKNMFRNFKLSSLSIRGLDIKRIDYDTFHTKCCANTLETLDLSNNKLIRLDSSLLSNLKRLVKIDFSNNNLQFSDKNFEFNKNLKVINLSNNKLQYLPSRIFYNLNELELIDLSDNHLTSIDSCTFNNIQTNPIKRQFAPAKLSLANNPINCNCDIFYLNRYLNIKVNATCNKPREYFGRQYSQLKQEDPSLRCQYYRMAKQCSVKDNLVEIIVIILLACLAFLFCSISICCFCKNAADQEKFKKFKNDFEDKQKPKRFRPKPVYVDISTGILPKSKQQQQDTEKLLS